MPKVVIDYGRAICTKVVPAPSCIAWAPPNWREGYVGLTGRLRLMESQQKRPGWQFLHFSGEDYYDAWSLRTWYGKPVLDGDVLTFRTKNSIYEFRLLEDNVWKN